MGNLAIDKILGRAAAVITYRREKRQKDVVHTVPADVEEFLDIPYKSRDGKELFMDVYKPVTEPGTELPVIVCVHGGALFLGSHRMSQGGGELLAQRGYLVCSLEYRLLPSVNVYEQVADICAGMDFVAKYLLNFDVDYSRLYMVAESAGAYLATYAVAMRYSRMLTGAIGYEASKMRFRAMALISGMYYTKKHDIVGTLALSMYGKDERSVRIAPYTNPEHPQVIYNLPPCLLVTSKADFIQHYTYEFGRALGENGIDHEILDMGEDKRLTHSFFFLHPDYPESAVVADRIAEWFRKYEPKQGK